MADRFPHLSLADLRIEASMLYRDAVQADRHGDRQKARNARRRASEMEACTAARLAALPAAA